MLDGVDLREYDLEDLWKEIGVIFQDFMRYDMTAAENIAIGRIDGANEIFHIRNAAMKSLAEGVIKRLPHEYDQMLGCRFDGGVDLSGGEWQKIALARAYLRDAQLLILDEPTASLDAKSESEVFERFAELTRGKMAHSDFASLLHGAHGRSHFGSGGRKNRGRRPARPADEGRRALRGNV